MPEARRFPFSVAAAASRGASSLPFLPLTLRFGNRPSVQAEGLLDTGATVSVLPYHVGLQLGATWSDDTPAVRLTGNLAQFEAQALLLTAHVTEFAPVRLAFAWTRADEVPLLLGQVNFFMEFVRLFLPLAFCFRHQAQERRLAT